MPLIVFFLVVVVVLIFTGGKKKKTTFTISPAQPRPIKVNPVALEYATRHFGSEWTAFVKARNMALGITIEKIRETIALVYAAMAAKTMEHLFMSFVQVSSSPNEGNGLSYNVKVTRDNYQSMHEGVYQLIISGRFEAKSVLELFNRLAEKHRQEKVDKKASSKQELLPERKEDGTQVYLDKSISSGYSDPSIIDVSGQGMRIDTEYFPAGDDVVPAQASYDYNYNPDDYLLGKKYKEQLGLSNQEASWLNKFYKYGNVFNSIAGCEVENVRIYLLCMKQVVRELKKLGTTLKHEIEPLKASLAAFEKDYYGHWGDYNYHTGSDAVTEVYSYAFKKVEMELREAWGHKRKIYAEFYSRSNEVKQLFAEKLGPLIDRAVSESMAGVRIPDEETERELNAATSTRWKLEFQRLTEGYSGTEHSELTGALYRLGSLNAKNPSVENVYYEASKFMAPLDRTESLKLYLHYIWHDLNSTVIDRKQMNKTVQKKLFASAEQLAAFQMIVDTLCEDLDLDQAIAAVEDLYKVKRKTIKLDMDKVRSVEEQHSGTVEVLNEYLDDGEEAVEIILKPAVKESQVMDMSPPVSDLSLSGGIALSSQQLQLLRLFVEGDYVVAATDLEAFAKMHSQFRNQLIDGINEACYELLDDVLIEEGDDVYEINPDYYQQIIS